MSSSAPEIIAGLRKDLEDIWARVQQDADTTTAFHRAERWHERAVRTLRDHVSADEAERLRATEQGGWQIGNPIGNLRELLRLYDSALAALVEELERDPSLFNREVEMKASGAALTDPDSRKVFIVHGHDEPNTYRLRDLLRDRYHLEPVIMSAAPGRGRTLIEKFEEIASDCRFAFVLLTPDDQIETPSGEYTQARPNVIFELGWFYGRLGRENVVLLLKEGTRIHSDLDGISQIRFTRSVEENVLDIERELEHLVRPTTGTG